MNKDLILDQLVNDEFSTDEEMIQFFIDEAGATKAQATKLVKGFRNVCMGAIRINENKIFETIEGE